MSFIFMRRTLAGPAARVKRNAPARPLDSYENENYYQLAFVTARSH